MLLPWASKVDNPLKLSARHRSTCSSVAPRCNCFLALFEAAPASFSSTEEPSPFHTTVRLFGAMSWRKTRRWGIERKLNRPSPWCERKPSGASTEKGCGKSLP